MKKAVAISLLSAFFFLLLLPFESFSIGCIGDDGKAVDWWVSLKMPRRKGIDNPSVDNGVGYGYLDQRIAANGFKLNAKSLDDPKSALFATLAQIYQKNKDVGYMMYNDADPTEDDSTSHYAHAKGVLGFDKAGAFWIIHSMPRFPTPPTEGKLEISDEQRVYGQSVLCISLSAAQASVIAPNLRINNPQIYGSFFPAPLDRFYAGLKDVVDKKAKITEVTGFANITVPSGVTFYQFAKNAKWGKDLYADLVSVWFSTGLFTETWQRPKEQSIYPPTSKFEIVEINALKFPGLNDKYSWEQGSDHSKWAISTLPSKGLVCIGDINRQKSQAKRGGGTLCFSHCSVYNAFTSIIVNADKSTPAPAQHAKCSLRM
eukprot:TRINITY_DN2938_c0_g1_i1.p1 TRINITY_DN2938_c0_g1~~TRINITY_DN2938_c0_g1_i1.p1  ORF type:complete len:373 (+),score=86.89 TRINITY_DN2938_c0_g1_i1:96-1214(+)